MSTNPLSSLSYTNKDFNSIYVELLDLVKKLTHKWDPSISNESDPGVILLKLDAIIGDKNNYNIDKNILEAFPETVTQEINARNSYKQLGYKMPWYQSSVTTLTMRWVGEPLEDGMKVTIPRYTMVTNDDTSIIYTILDQPVFTAVDTVVTAKAMEGAIVTHKVNGKEVLDLSNLDMSNRLFLNDYSVAENGIFITNEGTPDVNTWDAVDNLQVRTLGNKFYEFGVDSRNGICYVEFPEDIDALIGDGLKVKYLVSSGAEGNISAKTLDRFYEERTIDVAGTPMALSSDIVEFYNATAAVDGANPQELDAAFKAYRKTVGTFNTLVTLRDYINAIYSSGLISNGYVCDRNNDLQSTYTVVVDDAVNPTYTYIDSTTPKSIVEAVEDALEGAGVDASNRESILSKLQTSAVVPDMSAFDLRMYVLKNSGTVSNTTQFESTFEMVPSDSPKSMEVQGYIQEQQCISHDFKDIIPDVPCMFQNSYPVNIKIVPQMHLTSNQIEEVKINIIKSFYSILNSRAIDFGQEPDYDIIYDAIYQADERIKTAILDDFTYTTFAVYWDQNKKEFKRIPINHIDDMGVNQVVIFSTYDELTKWKTLKGLVKNNNNSNSLRERRDAGYFIYIPNDETRNIKYDSVTEYIYKRKAGKDDGIDLNPYDIIRFDTFHQEFVFYSNKFTEFQRNILLKSILSGHTPLIVADTNFNYALNHKFLDETELSKLTTGLTIAPFCRSDTSRETPTGGVIYRSQDVGTLGSISVPMPDLACSIADENQNIVGSYTLRPNETVRFLAPSFQTTKQFSNFIKFELVLNNYTVATQNVNSRTDLVIGESYYITKEDRTRALYDCLDLLSKLYSYINYHIIKSEPFYKKVFTQKAVDEKIVVDRDIEKVVTETTVYDEDETYYAAQGTEVEGEWVFTGKPVNENAGSGIFTKINESPAQYEEVDVGVAKYSSSTAYYISEGVEYGFTSMSEDELVENGYLKPLVQYSYDAMDKKILTNEDNGYLETVFDPVTAEKLYELYEMEDVTSSTLYAVKLLPDDSDTTYGVLRQENLTQVKDIVSDSYSDYEGLCDKVETFNKWKNALAVFSDSAIEFVGGTKYVGYQNEYTSESCHIKVINKTEAEKIDLQNTDSNSITDLDRTLNTLDKTTNVNLQWRLTNSTDLYNDDSYCTSNSLVTEYNADLNLVLGQYDLVPHSAFVLNTIAMSTAKKCFNIPSNTEYKLRQGESITFFWRNEDGDDIPYTYERYVGLAPSEETPTKKSPIIKANFQLEGIESSKFTSLHTQTGEIPIGTAAFDIVSGMYGSQDLSGTKTIDIREMNQIVLDRVNGNYKQMNRYYFISKVKEGSTDKQYVMNFELKNKDCLTGESISTSGKDAVDIGCKYNEDDADKILHYRYTLENDEYFIYTSGDMTEYEILGAGTLIGINVKCESVRIDEEDEIEGAYVPYYLKLKVDAIEYNKLIEGGIEVFADACQNINNTYEMFCREQQIYTIAQGNKLYTTMTNESAFKDKNRHLITASGKSSLNRPYFCSWLDTYVVGFEVSYSDDSGEHALPRLSVSDDIDCVWTARSYLNLNSAHNDPQEIVAQYDHFVDIDKKSAQFIAFKEEGLGTTSVYPSSSIGIQGASFDLQKKVSVFLESSIVLDKVGGNDVDITYMDGAGETKDTTIYVYEVDESYDSSPYDLRDDGIIEVSISKYDSEDETHIREFKLESGYTYIFKIENTSELIQYSLGIKKDGDTNYLAQPRLGDGSMICGYGYSYFKVDIDDKTAEIQFRFTGAVDGEDKLIIYPLIKGTLNSELFDLKDSQTGKYSYLFEKDEKGSNESDVFRKLSTLDYEGRYKYNHIVEDEYLIKDPLSSKSFFDFNHIYNSFTIGKAEIKPSEATSTSILFVNNR